MSESPVKPSTTKKILKKPPRYDRFFAAARKYNPLVLNEVRRAFQDNIREVLKEEARCTGYHGAENVRLALLIFASILAFLLFWESERVPFPENVPVMKLYVSVFGVVSGIALIYVFGYLEARNFSTLVLPHSSADLHLHNNQNSNNNNNNNNEDEESNTTDLARLERFMFFGGGGGGGSECDENELSIAEANLITSKYVDEEGNEILDEVDETKKENKVGDDDDDDDNDFAADDDEEIEDEADEAETGNNCDDSNLNKLLIPKRTKFEVKIVNHALLQHIFTSPSSSSSAISSSTMTDQRGRKKQQQQQQQEQNQQPLLRLRHLPQNLGLQFYSDIVPGEPQVEIEADLVVFRGALLSPKILKTCSATFSIEEFFSKEGIFYPPALRVEMRKMLKMLLLQSPSDVTTRDQKPSGSDSATTGQNSNSIKNKKE